MVSNPNLQFAKQDGVAETAVIAELGGGIFAEGEMDAIEGAILSNDKPWILPAAKPFECQITTNEGVGSENHIVRQSAIEPVTELKGSRGAHDEMAG
jgi:hypothetical protein